MWGARDNGDGDMVMTYKNTGVIPEVAVTPNGNYIKNTYDNIVYPVKTKKTHSRNTVRLFCFYKFYCLFILPPCRLA